MTATFADNTFEYKFVNENVLISIIIPLNFVHKGPIDNKSSLVQVMAWHQIGDKPLHDPMMSQFNDAYMRHLAPVPLSIFRSNSKFDENSERSSFKYTRPITTIFCTRHDSDTVVTCAKYLCDRPRIFYTRVF